MLVLDALDGDGDAGTHRLRAVTTAKGAVELGKSFPHATKKPPQPGRPARQPAVPLRRLVGQKLVVRMRGVAPSHQLPRLVRKGGAGGGSPFPDHVGAARGAPSLAAR